MSVCSDKPGTLLMYLSWSAFVSVDNTGEKKAAWINFVISAGVADGVVMAALARWVLPLLMLIPHSLLVLIPLEPRKITSPMNMMTHSCARNSASHPASQSLPIERREVGPSAGKRCASVAVLVGRQLMSRLPVWVEAMVLASGSSTFIGVSVG